MEFKVGQYIRKKNYMPFSNGVPVKKIKSIDIPTKGSKIPIINGSKNTKPEDVVIITPDERVKLMEEWNMLTISSIPSEPKEFQCIREDNGEPKVPISIEDIRSVLFSFQHRFPEGNFEGYKCPVCNKYHIGKSKKEELNLDEDYQYTSIN